MSKTQQDRITVRLTPRQLQVLTELKDALGVNISLLCRTIIGDFIIKNEDCLERIILKEQENNILKTENYDREETDCI